MVVEVPKHEAPGAVVGICCEKGRELPFLRDHSPKVAVYVRTIGSASAGSSKGPMAGAGTGGPPGRTAER
jgi:hypothetical protein